MSTKTTRSRSRSLFLYLAVGVVLLAVSTQAYANPVQDGRPVRGPGAFVPATAAHWFTPGIGTDGVTLTVPGREGLQEVPGQLARVQNNPESPPTPPYALSVLHWLGSSGSRALIASLIAGLVVALFLWLFSRWAHRASNGTPGQQPGSSTTLPPDSPERVDHRPDA